MSHPVSRFRGLGGLSAAIVGLLIAGTASVASAEPLTAEAAVNRAAQSNPTLRAALYDVSAAEHAVQAEQGARDPNFSAAVQVDHSETAPRRDAVLLAGSSARSSANTLSAKAAVSYTTELGTELELG